MTRFKLCYKQVFFLLLCVGLFMAGGLIAPVRADQGTNYYVDSANGVDTNSGTSLDKPWRTLGRVQSQALEPGDVVQLKSGSSWDGGLFIERSGQLDRPITFTSYGTGPKPVISNSGASDTWAKVIMIYANWVVLDGIAVRDVSEAGIYIADSSQHNITRNCEITNVGIGVAVYGQYNLVTNNYIHDLHMVVNTSGGDDDYGAVGAWLFSANNEVAHNTFRNCRSSSYDYGVDGGAIEFYGAVNNSYVHHNWAEDCAGFLEVGGGNSQGREAKDTRVAYNVLINNIQALHFNLGAYQYASDVSNFRFENNTVVESTPWETAINFVQGALTGNQLILRNNVFQGFYKLARTLVGGSESPSTAFTHEYNIYQGIGQSFGLGTGEILGDPLFVDLAAKNLALQASSPAIDSGINLGYTLDFVGASVPSSSAPDRGAYERQVQPPTSTPVQPTSTPAPTSTPTPSGPNRLTVPLYVGWNLISIPGHPTHDGVADVFSSIEGQYNEVLVHDSANPSDQWRIYVPSAPMWTNDLSVVNETMGIWVNAQMATTLTLTFEAPEPVAIPLYEGWNHVGYPSLTQKPVAEALASIDGKYNMVYEYDATTGAWRTYTAGSSPEDNLSTMVPGKGYWVWASEDCVWQVE